MATSFGKQRSGKAASAGCANAARDAGLIGRSAHGLRKTRLVALAEHGATTHHFAAWCGLKSLSKIEKYTKSADRKRLLTKAENPTQTPKSPTL
jgi:integrase